MSDETRSGDRSGGEAISRRGALRALAWYLALSPTLPLRAGAGDRSEPAPKSAAGLVRYRQAAVRIGRAVLAARPNESDAEQLSRLLGLGFPWTDDRDAAVELEALRVRHREDFLAGRVVVVGGFVLSETESRLAALVALQARRHP